MRNITQGNNDSEACCESHINTQCSCACDGFVNTFVENHLHKNGNALESIREFQFFDEFIESKIDPDVIGFYKKNYPDCFYAALEEIRIQYNNNLREYLENQKTRLRGLLM